jgi:hypothetical protein
MPRKYIGRGGARYQRKMSGLAMLNTAKYATG